MARWYLGVRNFPSDQGRPEEQFHSLQDAEELHPRVGIVSLTDLKY